jgi:hypothetical protein
MGNPENQLGGNSESNSEDNSEAPASLELTAF